MRFAPCWFGAFLWALLTNSAAQAGGIPAKTLKDLKAASVYIKVQFVPASAQAKTNIQVKPVQVTGSGFLHHVVGDVGFIVTNNHVISLLAGEVSQGLPSVVFNSGTPDEQIVNAQIVARDPLNDLAVLKVVQVKKLPRPIPMNPDIEVFETMPVYAIGFPFGADLALGRSNPAMTITKGTISSLRYDDRGQIKLVQVDAEVNSGNSGGPVVDEKGQLIGVTVSKVMKARTIGFAIPLRPVQEMMRGKVVSLAFDTLWVVKDLAEVTLEATLIDPLDHVKDVALYYAPLADGAEPPAADKEGLAGPLKDARPLWLKMSKTRGQGRLTLPGGGRKNVRLAYQTAALSADGTTSYSPVSVAVIDFTQVVYSDRLARGDVQGPGGLPGKTFACAMKAGKHYILEMRGDPRDLDPRLVVQDASGKVLAEDDGSGGIFDALLAFTPARDGDYQIVATASRGAGPFTLRIREDDGRKLGPKGLAISGTLKQSDPRDRVSLLPHQQFNFFLNKHKTYTFNLKSKDFDPYMRLENMAGVHLKNEDVGGGGHSTMYFSPFQDGIYRLVATAYDSGGGAFDLSVSESPGPKQYEVGPDGLKLADMLNTFDPADIINGKFSNFRCKVFEVKIKAGQKYQIDLVSNQFDAFLRIEDQRGRELASDDDSGGMLNARLVFAPPADGVYRVIATQFDARFGAFDLSVRPLP